MILDKQDMQQVKSEMCAIGQRIWQRGFCAGNEGNHSVRIGETVLCTPSGKSKGFLTPKDICLVDMAGNLLEGASKPTSEIKIHLALYRARTDIRAVIHSHPPHACAFAFAGIPLPEGICPEGEVFLGRVGFAAYATPSKEELAQSILAELKAHTTTILMANHGSVHISHDLESAYYTLEILDAYCRILLMARRLGSIRVLSAEKMTELLRLKASFGLGDDRAPEQIAHAIHTRNQPFVQTVDQQGLDRWADDSL